MSELKIYLGVLVEVVLLLSLLVGVVVVVFLVPLGFLYILFKEMFGALWVG